MRDSLNLKDFKRSIQTIRDCTSVISTHLLNAKTVQVRTLDNEALEPQNLQFIVTFKDDVENAIAQVKPLAEAIVLKGRVRFTVKPSKQYPELESYMSMFSEVIESSIREFLNKRDTIGGTNNANDNAKWLLH
ncbi:hypothetical protein [Candidatus Pantoea multigeneris]|uniref:Uncharacterized protein n=1 Tax=Candidatus Pantoea multigeneris TaxID=2608357 RepID=A0ABX0RG93_9GAMM|nr:hypothetical protein [Pantoea multigeneris]NIF22270.1 hypothetical protein [Pantoea multigeneris]